MPLVPRTVGHTGPEACWTDGPRRSLITCTGDFNDKSKSYADRLVVEATYAGLD